jgi:hypothetical protein
MSSARDMMLVWLVAAVVAYVILALGCAASRSAEPPVRAHVRGAVLAVALGVRVADDTCASTARATRDAPLAERCDAVYKGGRAALLVAEAALDAADSTRSACAAAQGGRALRDLAALVSGAGAALTPAIVDGLAMVDVLTRLAPCATDAGAR